LSNLAEPTKDVLMREVVIGDAVPPHSESLQLVPRLDCRTALLIARALPNPLR